MKWHIIQGEPGCEYAIRHKCAAIVVDALRASAMTAMLLHHGAQEILVVTEVEDAFAAREEWPDALLYGERGGLPPTGFDYGNSPQEALNARGRRVIFTTTSGAKRLFQCWGAPVILMGTILNASAVAAAANEYETDVVLIPAGLATDPAFSAQEDWVAATVIAMKSGAVVGEGVEKFTYWRQRIEAEGVAALFAEAPHAEKLRKVGLQMDIDFCSQIDITVAIPVVRERVERGIVLSVNSIFEHQHE